MKPIHRIAFNTDEDSLMEIYENILDLVKDQSTAVYQIVKPIVDYYENIISCMPGNVYWLNKDCQAVGCNRNVLNMLGLKESSDFCGLSFEEQSKLGHWSNKQEKSFKKDTEEVIRTGRKKASVEEPPVPGPNGRDIHFLTTRIPLFNKNLEVIGVVGISMDITDHKHTQEALKKAEGKIDGMMLVGACIAHELRTPLAGIKSALYGLENCLPIIIQGYKLAVENRLIDPEINDQHLDALQEVVSNMEKKVNHCNIVIDMLLTNLAHHKISSLDFKTCSIKNCINEALEKYTFRSGQRELINVKIENDFNFFGNEVLIVHIIFNLLKNALYFIHKAGKGNIHIWTEPGENGDHCLHFKDTGLGISEKSLSHIFDQFFTENTHHGAGIGLAFSRMVMEAHKGTIVCQSKYNQYADFILTFPASQG
jgi:nitrogen-specific signal transduction histidine kinase